MNIDGLYDAMAAARFAKEQEEKRSGAVAISARMTDGKLVLACDHISLNKFPVVITVSIGDDKKIELCNYCYQQVIRHMAAKINQVRNAIS